MNNYGTFTKLRPLSLLRHLSNSCDSTRLRVASNSVYWSIYLEKGKLTYATHSIEPFDRLERHLRRLSHQIPTLKSETRVQLRLMFEPDFQSQSHLDTEENSQTQLPADYQAICWLVGQRHLHPQQAGILIQELLLEVIESFSLIKQGTYELKNTASNKMPIFGRFDVEKIVERCQQRLQNWQSLAPQISSPYQRPYLWIQSKKDLEKLPDLQQESLTNWMKGFSLRHLAVITNEDELQLAKKLHPHILNGLILLHEPDPPFDHLPKIATPVTGLLNAQATTSLLHLSTTNKQELPVLPISPILTSVDNINIELPQTVTKTETKVYKIVSVDDSPTFLKEITRFLEDESFSVTTVNDPVKAVMSIIRSKPDLILLDLNMDKIDGYELCRLIRNNSSFKNTPIVMVTGSKGIIDKVRARFVGASGYLTKPFTRAELLKMVFMHLT